MKDTTEPNGTPKTGTPIRTITEMVDGKERKITIYAANEALRAKLREMRETGWSNNKFGTRLGISPAVISQYLNDRGCIYNGDTANLEHQFDDLLRNEERRRTSGVASTWCDVAEQMLVGFEYIRKTNDIGAIIAESGDGKTRGIEVIRERHPLAMLFTVRAWSNDKNSVQSALWDVVPHLGYNAQTKRAAFMATSLRGSDRPLLVDDAHKLTRPALHWLFDFWEETSIPIALIGTPELLPKLEDDSQRFSRVGHYTAIKSNWSTKAGQKSARDLLDVMIKSLAKDCAASDKAELLELCETVAKHHGHFRSVEKQLKLAAELRSNSKPTSWPDAFRQAHTLLIRKYNLD